MAKDTSLKVTSDVRRDLLASAAAFKTEAAVVWEYVVNGLQYVDRGISPRIQVTVRPRAKEIEISDNGRGMDADDLSHFFRMHGENLERKAGRPGRGKFGTGKSAAFGIAARLRVESRRNGLLNAVELTRQMISQSTGDAIPLNWVTRNAATTLANGTTITISDVALVRIAVPTIIEYVERHLQAFRNVNPQVAINDHLCEYREPAIAETFEFTPSAEQSKTVGSIKLVVKVAQAPLPETEQGVAITAGPGNLVAVERAGIERKEFGNYLFGTVDAPLLESHSSLIEPYDSSRSLSLNTAHPVAAVLISFIGAKLDEVRARLVQREREARKSVQSLRLAKEAERIAEILNADFEHVRQRLDDIRSAASKSGSARSAFGNGQAAGSETDEWVEGIAVPGDVEESTARKPGNGTRGRKAPTVAASGTPNPDGSSALDPSGGNAGSRSRPRGGFKVAYRNLGPDEMRSVYDPNALAILINLDNPVLAAALGEGGVEEQTFRRLSYEVAFSEYSLALGYEMAKKDPDMPADDLLYEVRHSLNRISNAAAALYR